MGSMREVFEALLSAVDWTALRSASGTATTTPNALRRLVDAQSEDEATNAYWDIDNEIIVQGRMYDSVPPIIGPIAIAMQLPGLHGETTYRLMELLTEFALGLVHEDEPDPEQIRESATNELRRMTFQIYAYLSDSDPRLRADALGILRVIDQGSERLRNSANTLSQDEDERVRELVNEI